MGCYKIVFVVFEHTEYIFSLIFVNNLIGQKITHF